jgi:tetratricopeptide (TPR) repeat protein
MDQHSSCSIRKRAIPRQLLLSMYSFNLIIILTCSSIIAIHGLGANPDTTWVREVKDKTGATRSIHWLKDKDMLPSLVPDAQIWTFCYNSKWLGEAPIHHLDSLGIQLLTLIHQNRPESSHQKPIVFIAHSFGGIILEEALTSAAIADQYKHILNATTGIIFLGTPFRGSTSVEQASLIADAANVLGYDSSKTLLSSLTPTSQRLAELLSDFTKTAIAENLRIVCFFEQVKTVIVRNMGLLSRATKRIIVPKAQAILEVHPAIGLGTAHTDMNEFSGPDDNNYRLVSGQICETIACSQSILRSKSKPQPAMLLPYLRNPDFVGRIHIMQQLSTLLNSGRRCAGLYGLGGIGKSQVAIEYAHSTRDKTGQAVFWIYAANRARFEQSFLDIAKIAEIQIENGKPREIMMLVKNWLESRSESWLLVIDNADDGELFSSQTASDSLSIFIPNCSVGSVLFTSRDKKICIDLVGARSSIKVDEMSPSECKELLQNLLSDEIYQAADVVPLIQTLHQIPLALTQAAAYMERNMKSASEYLKLLLAEKELSEVELLSQEFKTEGRDRDSFNAITKTWSISFEQIGQQQPLSAQLLCFMAYIDKQAIPEDLLYNASQPGPSQIEFDSALGTLLAFSIITKGTSTGYYNIHRLVQVCTRYWLTKSGKVEETLSQTVKIMVNGFPSVDLSEWPLCVQYMPHAQAVLGYAQSLAVGIGEESLLLNKVGFYLLGQGQLGKAELYMTRELELSQASLGLEHLYTAGNLAELLDRQWPKIISKVPAEDITNIIITMINLAMTIWELGRRKESEKLTFQVMELSKKILGADNIYTLRSTNNLATIYQRPGRLEEAEKLVVQLVGMKTKILGAENFSTLGSRGLLASIYSSQGRYAEAEQIEIQLVELQKRLLGPEHPGTLITMSSLAITYQNSGRLKEAEKLGLQVSDIQTRVLGAEHSSTLTSLNNLALIYNEQGRSVEARELMVQIMETEKRIRGIQHPATLTSMHNLAAVYMKQGRETEAEHLLIQVVDLKKRVQNLENASTLLSMSRLASIYTRQSRWKEAEKLDVEIMEAKKKLFGPKHKETLKVMQELGVVYQCLGEWDKAENIQLDAVANGQETLGADDLFLLLCKNQLAVTYTYQQRWDQAELLSTHVVERRKKLLGSEDPEILDSLNILRIVYGGLANWQMLETTLLDLIEHSTRILGVDHADVWEYRHQLASAYYKQELWEEAEEMFIQTIEARKRVLGPDNPSTLESLHQLAHTWDQLGRDGALDLMASTHAISGKVLGEDHPHNQLTKDMLEVWESRRDHADS